MESATWAPTKCAESQAQIQLLFIQVGGCNSSLSMSAFGLIFLGRRGASGGSVEKSSIERCFIYKSLRALLNLVHLSYCVKLVIKLKRVLATGLVGRRREVGIEEDRKPRRLCCLCQVVLPQLVLPHLYQPLLFRMTTLLPFLSHQFTKSPPFPALSSVTCS